MSSIFFSSKSTRSENLNEGSRFYLAQVRTKMDNEFNRIGTSNGGTESEINFSLQPLNAFSQL